MTDDKLREQKQRGDRAKSILESDLFVEAFEEIKKEIFDAWCNSQPSETDKRERAHVAVCMLDRIKSRFEQWIANGKVADNELLKRGKESKLKQAFR